MFWLLLLMVIAPSIGLTTFFYLRDRYEPEPKGHVARAFLYGLLVFVPAFWLGGAVGELVSAEFLALGGLRAELYHAFLMVALPEEAVKMALFASTILMWDELDEPFDGIVYGVALALGFATLENVAYVARAYLEGELPVRVAALRAVLAVPAHAIYGAVQGYYLGSAKMSRRKAYKVVAPAAGFVLSWIFHAGYDMACTLVGPLWGWLLLGTMSASMWLFVLLLLPRALRESPFRPRRVRGSHDLRED